MFFRSIARRSNRYHSYNGNRRQHPNAQLLADGIILNGPSNHHLTVGLSEMPRKTFFALKPRDCAAGLLPI
jgi:hypothetical protein